jgi:poly(beta-D-mannuronate) lyase
MMRTPGGRGRGRRRQAAAVAATATALVLTGSAVWPGAAAPDRAGAPAATRVVGVSSAAQLTGALAQARPGDRIEVADGVYAATPFRLTRPGTAAAPITIAARNRGRAEIRGTAGFQFAGAAHVVIEGFHFNGTGLQVPPGALAVRITRNTFTGGSGNVLTVSEDDSEVDHNTFQRKRSQGVYLQVSGAGSGMAKRVRIHHNYFFDHQFTGSNGGESIRLGYSHKQHQQARAVVEYNLFERADGDSEAISVKSSDNTIRYNTLRNSRGEITLRHGNRNLVEGNFILGGVSGIRFYGNDHVIINNVVQGISGKSVNVGGGDIRDDTASTTSHEAADRCLVAFNTLVGTRSEIIGVGGGKPYAPDRITFADNIVVGTGTLARVHQGTNLSWQGNIAHGGSAGMPAGGYRAVDPRLTQGAGGLNRLRAGSPAIDTAAGSYPQVTRDMDLQTRSGAKDVGADEFSTGGTLRQPLTSADVGPGAS